MWCVFIEVSGAYCKYVAFTDEIDKLLEDKAFSSDGDQFYAAFVKESDGKRFVDLINSATF